MRSDDHGLPGTADGATGRFLHHQTTVTEHGPVLAALLAKMVARKNASGHSSPSHAAAASVFLVKLVRQRRDRQNCNPFFDQGARIVDIRLAMDRALLDETIVNLARLLRETHPDILDVFKNMFAESSDHRPRFRVADIV
jgi:hypothetical protein